MLFFPIAETVFFSPKQLTKYYRHNRGYLAWWVWEIPGHDVSLITTSHPSFIAYYAS